MGFAKITELLALLQPLPVVTVLLLPVVMALLLPPKLLSAALSSWCEPDACGQRPHMRATRSAAMGFGRKAP
jgi:hypothetical protein